MSWTSFNISVASSSCNLDSTALTADTQPTVADQAYQLVFSISDSYGNVCAVPASRFVVTAQGYPPLTSSVIGQYPSRCSPILLHDEPGHNLCQALFLETFFALLRSHTSFVLGK